MSVTAARLIHLIMLLQRQPNQKGRELAARLGVSERTLHRYLARMDEMGIPIYAERGPYGGISLVRGYRMPPLVLTPEESVAVYLGVGLAEDLWGPLYREAAHTALAKLDNLLPDEQRREAAWARRYLVAAGLHRGDLDALAPTLEILRRAARDHLTVRMLYQSASRPDPTGRELEPYALVYRSGWGYVVGYCRLRQQVRTFRLDRIQELTLLDTRFTPPADFDLAAYLENDRQLQAAVRVRMRFATWMKQAALDNRHYWETLEEQPDGSVLVSYAAPNVEWAASTALAYGPGVCVLEPAEVRRAVADWAAAIAAQYADTP
jgi:predicted DNA-binding transcriptional regulator YafY